MSLKFDRNKKIALGIWLTVAIFTIVQGLITHRYNNYLIFENTFRNLIQQTSFYKSYPQYHFDANHYGPVFSVFFIPFAVLPTKVGFAIWNIFTTLFLFKAIATLPLKNATPIYLISIPCLVSSCLSQQSNPLIAAFIILSYTLLNKNKGLWATLFIMLGTFIKLYGIVGLSLFFFVKDRKRFVLYLIMWSVVFFVLPMLFSSPSFILNSYQEWAISLSQKNANNLLQDGIDISIMGFARHLFANPELPNLAFLVAGALVFLIPYFNFKKWEDKKFQLLILASTLMFPVLFSTGSEDCTYIIAMPAVGIWYLITEKRKWKNYLIAAVFIFSCNFPQFIYHSVALKYPISFTVLSLPFFIVWLLIIFEAYQLKTKITYA
jgi:hypothetical protein